MKKILLFSLLVSLVVLQMPTDTLAITAANTSQSGSLLMFPLVDTRGDNDTIITIANNADFEVWLTCYTVRQDGELQNWLFPMYPSSHVWFSLAGGYGEAMLSRQESPGHGRPGRTLRGCQTKSQNQDDRG